MCTCDRVAAAVVRFHQQPIQPLTETTTTTAAAVAAHRQQQHRQQRHRIHLTTPHQILGFGWLSSPSAFFPFIPFA